MSESILSIFDVLSSETFQKSAVVSETSENKEGGFTVYKIVFKAASVKSLEKHFQFYVWKRFREVDRLHRQLELVHKQLYLEGNFPTFPKPTFFHKKDTTVIEERRQSIKNLINFVLDNKILCQAKELKSFLKDCQIMEVGDEDSVKVSTPVLKPTEAMIPPKSESSDVDRNIDKNTPQQNLDRSRLNSSGTAHDLPSDLSCFDPCQTETNNEDNNSAKQQQHTSSKNHRQPHESNLDLLSSVGVGGDKKS